MQLTGERRSSSSSTRLPVNPRRHKVAPEQRKRVATACNNCNVRRVKCSGDRPCTHCAASSRECIYPEPIEKVSVPRSELDELRKKADVYEKALRDAMPDSARRQELLNQLAADAGSPVSTPSTSTSPLASIPSVPAIDKESPMSASVKTEHTADDETAFFSPSDRNMVTTAGRRLRDGAGTVRFMGETSGAVFLDHLKETLAAVLPPIPPPAGDDDEDEDEEMSSTGDGRGFVSSLGRYQTNDGHSFGDRDVDPLWLPSRNVVGAMLAALRHLIQDGNGEWPSGGIYWWGELGSVPSPASASPSHSDDTASVNKFRHLAFYHTALAIASHGTSAGRGGGPQTPTTPGSDFAGAATMPNPSDDFFARAALLIGNPLDVTRCSISDAAVLALMAYYLIEVDRRDAASMYVSAAMNICVTMGAHRGCVDERGKRVFWTVYILDRWLSCLSGRPSSLSDDAIHIPLPADAPSMPPAAGLKAHVELSRISGQIVNDTLRGVSGSTGAQSSDRALWTLQQWQSALPAQLQLSPEGISNDPACCMLHMRCHQLVIVATRGQLLQAANAAIRARFGAQYSSYATVQNQAVHIKACLSAARRNIRLGRHVVSLGRNRKLLHAGLHFVYNAAVCLVLQELVREPDTAATGQDASASNRDIDFVIDRLEREGVDREADTLRDLRVLIGRIASMPVSWSAETGTDPATLMSSSSPLPGNIDPLLSDDMGLWLDEDWPMYNIYMES